MTSEFLALLALLLYNLHKPCTKEPGAQSPRSSHQLPPPVQTAKTEHSFSDEMHNTCSVRTEPARNLLHEGTTTLFPLLQSLPAPSSFEIFVFSRMNLPSLYFCKTEARVPGRRSESFNRQARRLAHEPAIPRRLPHTSSPITPDKRKRYLRRASSTIDTSAAKYDEGKAWIVDSRQPFYVECPIC
jgi:hypothetical protein